MSPEFCFNLCLTIVDRRAMFIMTLTYWGGEMSKRKLYYRCCCCEVNGMVWDNRFGIDPGMPCRRVFFLKKGIWSELYFFLRSKTICGDLLCTCGHGVLSIEEVDCPWV